jgi:hypothetical protein
LAFAQHYTYLHTHNQLTRTHTRTHAHTHTQNKTHQTKGKNLGKVGVTSFKSRSFAEWQKSGGKNLFPVDPTKVKNAKDIPYMQRGGAPDDSDLKKPNFFDKLFKKPEKKMEVREKEIKEREIKETERYKREIEAREETNIITQPMTN